MLIPVLWIDPPESGPGLAARLSAAGFEVVAVASVPAAIQQALADRRPRVVMARAGAMSLLLAALRDAAQPPAAQDPANPPIDPFRLVIIPADAEATAARDAIAGADAGVVEPLTADAIISRLRFLRTQTAEALGLSEDRFALAFFGSPDAINLNRVTDGLYVDVNPGFLALTGYTREEVIGRTSLELNIWETPAHRAAFVDRLSRDQRIDNMEASFRMKDGFMRTALISARIIVLQGQAHVISVTRDISDKKQAELALQASEARFRRITENMSDLVAELDLQGRFRYVCPAYRQTLGLDPEALVGQLAFERVHPEDVELVRRAFVHGLTNGDAGVEFRYQHADGRWIWFQTTGHAVIGGDGRPEGVVIASRDISERRRDRKSVV